MISWSVTLRLDATVKKAIGSIDETAWQTINYTDAVYDEPTGQWISRAEVAEVPFTAFCSARKSDQVPGRLIVRRIPDLNRVPGPEYAVVDAAPATEVTATIAPVGCCVRRLT